MVADPPVHPAANLFPLMDRERLASLAANIKAYGQHDPIVLWQGQILDGRNRLAACRFAGVEPRYVDRTAAISDPYEEVWTVNAERRDLEAGQRGMIRLHWAREHEDWIAKQAEARQRACAKHSEVAQALPRSGGRFTVSVSRDTETVSSDRERSRIEAFGKVQERERTRLAKEAQISEATAGRVLALDHKAPDLAAQVAAGTIGLGEAAREAKRRDPPVAPPLPAGKYRVLLADPPWRYEHCESETREIENQYPTMDLDAICNLPIADLAAPSSVLYLWATSPKVEEAIQVMRAWGFSYRTCLVWVKDRIGMGYWARQRHELLLVGVMGAMSPPPPELRPDSVIEAPRGEHSEKPAAVYELIERQWTSEPRIELFARAPREGWARWGNQA